MRCKAALAQPRYVCVCVGRLRKGISVQHVQEWRRRPCVAQSILSSLATDSLQQDHFTVTVTLRHTQTHGLSPETNADACAVLLALLVCLHVNWRIDADAMPTLTAILLLMLLPLHTVPSFAVLF